LNGILLVIFQLPVQEVLNKHKQSTLLVMSMLLLSVGMGGHLVSRDSGIFFVCAIIWTLGELLNIAISSNVTSQMAPYHLLVRYMGILLLSYPIASLIGPILGTMILDVLGANGVWVGCSILSVFGAFAVWQITPRLNSRIGKTGFT